MASYPPPTENIPFFNSLLFTEAQQSNGIEAGPTGPVGPAGPAGTLGQITVYSNPGPVSYNNYNEIVYSNTLPSGTYLILATPTVIASTSTIQVSINAGSSIDYVNTYTGTFSQMNTFNLMNVITLTSPTNVQIYVATYTNQWTLNSFNFSAVQLS